MFTLRYKAAQAFFCDHGKGRRGRQQQNILCQSVGTFRAVDRVAMVACH